MIDYDFSENYVIIHFKDSVYPYDVVVEALNDFKDSCWIVLDGLDKNDFSVYLEPKENEGTPQEAFGSFFNYLLGLMHTETKQFDSVN